MEPAQASGIGAIFILDGDRRSREALRVILQASGYLATCFADERALLEAVRQTSPVCIFLDLMLPNDPELKILADLADYPAPILVTSSHANISTAVKAIRGGATDFIPKPFCADEIALRVEQALKPRLGKSLPDRRPSTWDFPGWETLSHREKEVLDKIAAGLSSKEIGLALGISSRTVEDHRANLLRKLEVRNSTELMIALLKWRSEMTGSLARPG